MRSEVTHKSPPDYCVCKLVLHGKILREVRGHTYINQSLIIVLVYYMGRFYVRTLTLRKIFPYKVTNVNTGNTLHVTSNPPMIRSWQKSRKISP